MKSKSSITSVAPVAIGGNETEMLSYCFNLPVFNKILGDSPFVNVTVSKAEYPAVASTIFHVTFDLIVVNAVLIYNP